ncbi:hypothetical protein niasHS_001868 [Heterodera schachtii]|uniref:Homeobox domain-containing protein n=1 Tax=Heterodera schachtii TaxID=97005 RepID=A0ABD2KAU0_HETSC
MDFNLLRDINCAIFDFMQQQKYSADQLIKLENEFSKTMCPSASAHAQLAKETGLTEKQIEQWFERRRTVWKFYLYFWMLNAILKRMKMHYKNIMQSDKIFRPLNWANWKKYLWYRNT